MYLMEKRLQRLEELAAMRQKEKWMHEPYYQVVPWSIMRDNTIVYYHPEGNYKSPEVYKNLPFASVVQWAIENCERNDIVVYMDSCQEWLFLHSQTDGRYTTKQREKCKENWLKDYPELEMLLTDEHWMKMADVLKRIPQSGVFQKI